MCISLQYTGQNNSSRFAHVWERERRFLGGLDFWPYLKGVTKDWINLPVQTAQEIAEQYAVKRLVPEREREGAGLRWSASDASQG
ncbi:MAG: hypothetical protein NVS2B4_12770 [Ramlibacter sp.]